MRAARTMVRTIPFAASVLFLAACTQTSVPIPAAPAMGVKLRQDITSYEVTGATAREIRASISERARLQPDGTGYAGYTRWNVRYTYEGSRPRPGGCTPYGVNVDLELIVRYPVWTDSASAPIALRQEWIRYVGALKAHEGNHAAIAIKGANRLSRAISAITAPNCATVGVEATNLFNAEVRKIRSEGDAYDATTRNGSTEGATLGAGNAAP